MSKLLRTKRFIWLLSFLLVSALSLFGYSAGKRYFSEASWVRHTFVVTSSIQRVMAAVTEAETGQRGYLLTGNGT
jgi:CHASE3 domain sensor protein